MSQVKALLSCCAVTLLLSVALYAQTSPDLALGRVIGQTSLTISSTEPNLVEGRELNGPQGVTLDYSATPPIVYVSDTFNNRVLGWRDSAGFQNGAPADIVIGQPDKFSTDPQGPPPSALRTGLWRPTGLVTDAQGNLYVIDSRNNRILRFPRPFQSGNSVILPDMVLGQSGFSTFNASASATGLDYTTGCGSEPDNVCALRGSLVFDSTGNLWVTDSGNNRVLRYPADPTGNGRVLTTADLVLGQPDFTTTQGTGNSTQLGILNDPSGLAIDSSGRLYVSDSLHRVVVFLPPFTNGRAGARLIAGYGPVYPPTAKTLNTPEGVTVLPNGEVLVADTVNNRILRYTSFESWPADNSQPAAFAVVGQSDFVSGKANVGPGGLSAPVHVAVGPNNDLFIADSLNNRVLEWPQNSYTATRVLGQVGLDFNAANLVEGREMFIAIWRYSPTGNFRKLMRFGGAVAVDTRTTPRLYIADTYNNRVLGYCDARKAKPGDRADLVIGQPDFFHTLPNGSVNGTPTDQYVVRPNALAVDTDGSLYVADSGNSRVVRFAAPCDQPSGSQNFPHANLVLGQPDFRTANAFASAATLSSPSGLAFTPRGYLAVSDAAQHRVVLFKRSGGNDFSNGMNASTVFGQPDFFSSGSGGGLNSLNTPQHIAFDSSARLYICDLGNNRVLIFNDAENTGSNPTAVFQITSTNQNQNLFNPRGIWINRDTGEIWLASPSYGSVLRYPEFQSLIIGGGTINGAVPVGAAPLALVFDGNGHLFTAEAANRVGIYAPHVYPVDGAAFFSNRALAPGIIASVWVPGTQASSTWASALPLPKDMGGVQVLVNGTPAPLFFVSDSKGASGYAGYIQINFQVPMSAPQNGTAQVQVIDTGTQAMLGMGAVTMAAAAPAIFTPDSAQATSGNPIRVSAYNGTDITDNQKRTCNGPSGPPAPPLCPGGYRPAKVGEIVEMYLTGAGSQSGWPAEGNVSGGPAPTDGLPHIILGTQALPDANIKYSGAAPCCAGLWQIDFEIPNANIAPGQPNPIAIVYRSIASRDVSGKPKTSIWIQ